MTELVPHKYKDDSERLANYNLTCELYISPIITVKSIYEGYHLRINIDTVKCIPAENITTLNTCQPITLKFLYFSR